MTYARYSTYGELYTAMATTTGEIPIAIYRTEENADSVTAAQNVSMQCIFIYVTHVTVLGKGTTCIKSNFCRLKTKKGKQVSFV